MPNWCENELIINKKDLKYVLNLNKRVDFNVLVPEPKNPDECPGEFLLKDGETRNLCLEEGREWFNWYDWHYRYWGVKWNACETYINEEDDFVYVDFSTPWGPPDNWLVALSEVCDFELNWHEEGGFSGHFSAQNGIIEDVEHGENEW